MIGLNTCSYTQVNHYRPCQIDGVIECILKLISQLPLPVLYGLSDVAFSLIYYGLRLRRKTVFLNLQNSFPDSSHREKTGIARRFYRNYADVTVEMIKALTLDKAELLRRVRINNLSCLKRYFEAHQPVIMLVAHQGNLDWLLAAMAQSIDCPLDAVYKPLKNKTFDQVLYRLRRRFGARPIAHHNALVEIIRHRHMVRGIALAADQLPRKGKAAYWVTFLHQDTAFFLGAEKFAQALQYPVVFVGMQRTARGQYEASVRPLAEPPYVDDHPLITERYAHAVEEQILANPADWMWAHQRWKYKKPLYG